ncbi:MAG TPA: hypothetical protein VGK04_02540 [Thermoanaerobaculia bacterium]
MRKLLSLSIALIAVLGVSMLDLHAASDVLTANGQVTVVVGTTLQVLTVPKGEVTVQTDASTVIRKQGEQITAAQINAGDHVNCLGLRIDNQTMKARQIEVRGNSQ